MSDERRHVLETRPLSTLSDRDMVEEAKYLSELPRSKHPLLSGMDVKTIAFSGQDQIVKGENPYWEIVRYMPGMPAIFGEAIEPDGTWALGRSSAVINLAHEAGVDRFALCARYSWAIPSPGDIAWLERELLGQAVVEIGAGSGYWAWQMNQGGIETTAFDPNPPGDRNWFNTHKVYYPVLEGDHTIAAGYPDRALMISWPGYECSWAAEALALYRGDTLVYIGEGQGGCCADDDFFADLDAHWTLDASCGAHVRYWGIHDDLEIWRRKP